MSHFFLGVKSDPRTQSNILTQFPHFYSRMSLLILLTTLSNPKSGHKAVSPPVSGLYNDKRQGVNVCLIILSLSWYYRQIHLAWSKTPWQKSDSISPLNIAKKRSYKLKKLWSHMWNKTLGISENTLWINHVKCSKTTRTLNMKPGNEFIKRCLSKQSGTKSFTN